MRDGGDVVCVWWGGVCGGVWGGGGSVGTGDFSIKEGVCAVCICVAVCVLCGDRLMICLVIAL